MLKWTIGAFVGASLLMSSATLPDPPTETPKVTERSFDAANGMRVTVRMVAPYAADTDLQIICVFKHDASGDKYLESMKTFDDKVGGLLSSIRNRGEFVGDVGETFYFPTWTGSITPKRVLVIGLGAEKDLSLETLRIVGRVAAREAVRLKAARVAFAPTIRDQGNSTLDVGDCDRAVMEQVVLTYDTEKRLQAQKITEPFDINEWVVEAGPKFVESAIEKVGKGIASAGAAASARSADPYRRATP